MVWWQLASTGSQACLTPSDPWAGVGSRTRRSLPLPTGLRRHDGRNRWVLVGAQVVASWRRGVDGLPIRCVLRLCAFPDTPRQLTGWHLGTIVGVVLALASMLPTALACTCGQQACNSGQCCGCSAGEQPQRISWWEAAKGIWHAGCPDCAIIGLPLVCSLRWFEQVNLLAARRTTCRVLLARKYTILHKAGAASGLGLGDAFVKRVAFFLTFCRPGLYSGPSWGHCCVPGGV